MNTVQKIAKNMGVLLLSQIVVYIIGFFNIMYTARYLGVENFGILSFALALTGIFGIISNPGFTTLAVREIAKDKSLASKYVGNILAMQLILFTVNLGLIVITVNLLKYPEQTLDVVYLITLSTTLSTFSGMFYSIFQAYEKMEHQSVGQIMSSLLMFIGILFAMSQKFSIVGFASIYVIVNAIVLAYTFMICMFKFVKPKIEIDWHFWMSTIKEALPFGMATIFAMLYIYIDSVMISFLKGDVEVGLYNAAYRLVLVLSIIPSIYFTSIFPVASRLYKKSEDLLQLTFERSIKYMLMLAIPIAIGTTLLADKIILLFFGVEFASSIVAMQILIWSEVFIFISLPCAYLLRSINKQSADMKATGLGVIINILLNLSIIPKYGYIGACFTTMITECCVLFILLHIISKNGYNLFNSSFFENIFKFIISSIIFGVFIWYNREVNIFILILMSMVIYFVSLFLMKIFDTEDKIIFKKLVIKSTNSNGVENI